jgi:hypothetical protein
MTSPTGHGYPVSHADDIVPVPVTVHNFPPATPAYGVPDHATCTTLLLTAQDPVQQLAPEDPLGCEVTIIQPGDNDIVVCHSKGEAQSVSNTIAALPNPSGAIIPKTYPAPVQIRTKSRLLVTAQAFPTRVSVILTRRTGN